MPQFAYEAQDNLGNVVVGVLQSASEREAVHKLNDLRLLPLKVFQQATTKSVHARVSKRQQVKLYQMLADLLDSGMPLLRALELLTRQTKDPTLSSVLGEVTSKVTDGSSLSAALGSFPAVFDELTCNVIRAGEEGGFLEQSLQRVAALHERRSALVNTVAGALAYPAFLLCVGFCVVIGMVVFFVPKFEPLFDRMRSAGELPWATELLLSTSAILRSYGLLLALASAALLFTLAMYLRTPAGRLRLDRLKLTAFVIGPITLDATLSVIFRVLGTLVNNGVPLLDALRITRGTATNRVLNSIIDRASQRIASGGSLADNLDQDNLIPSETIEVLRVGEQSNRLESVLIKLADQLDVRTQQKLSVLTKMIEPVLMVIMAIVIGFLMAALLLPVFLSSGRFN